MNLRRLIVAPEAKIQSIVSWQTSRLKGGCVRFGSKTAFAAQNGMSVLTPKADSCSALAHVRYGPIADILSN